MIVGMDLFVFYLLIDFLVVVAKFSFFNLQEPLAVTESKLLMNMRLMMCFASLTFIKDIQFTKPKRITSRHFSSYVKLVRTIVEAEIPSLVTTL